MIINENDSVYNNVPKNAIGVCKEMSIIELKNFLRNKCKENHWGLYRYWNMMDCAVARGMIEDKEVYRWICSLLDRERDIQEDREYYRNNK